LLQNRPDFLHLLFLPALGDQSDDSLTINNDVSRQPVHAVASRDRIVPTSVIEDDRPIFVIFQLEEER
jgi:hypothetical protein